MRVIVIIIIVVLIISCKEKQVTNNVQDIVETSLQEKLFKDLTRLSTSLSINNVLNDSLAFLILPLQKSCAACRKKTIDSIMKHLSTLDNKHSIIISANGGKKSMNAFFREQHYELPNEKNFFLDSANLAGKYELYTDNPVFYYSSAGKVYRKVSAVPATIKSDLKIFFSN